MELPFELFVATRYLLARRRQAFISLISLISALGVAVGVMALLIVLALMTGLQAELRERIVGSAAHVYLLKAGGLGPLAEELPKARQLPGVLGAAPVVLGVGLARTGGEQAFVTIKGIDAALEATVTTVAGSMRSGSLAAIAPVPGEPPGIVLGKDLAEKLGASVGDSVEILTQEGELTPFGLMPRNRTFRVAGVFALGFFQFDDSYGYVDLGVAQRLLGKPGPDWIELRIADMFEARTLAASVPDRLGSEYQAQDWQEMNSSLFSALWLEKTAMTITIGLIVMVAALNIIASLILLVMEKTRDIAILKTIGCSSASIRRIFVLQGLVIGLAGTAVGALAGTAIVYVVDRYKLIQVPLDVYQIAHVPFTLEPLDFLAVVSAAVVVCFVATIYPSRQAARLDPAQALRYQ